MLVGSLCVREVDLVDRDETVTAAAARMRDRSVGTLVVIDDRQKPVGIITDRDLTLRVLAAGRDAQELAVDQVMTIVPRTVREDTPVEEAITIMRGGPFRRLLVVNEDEKLVGLLSIDDVINFLVDEFREVGDLLERENPANVV